MTTYLPKAGMSAIRYNGPSTPNHDTMLGWYYENLAKPPPAGRKRCVVLCPQLGGFTGSAPITQITPASGVLYGLIDRGGFDLFVFTVPPARGGSTGNPTSGGTYGPSYLGNGCNIPLGGHDPPSVGSNPTGYVGTHPILDHNWFMAWKCVLMAVQMIQHWNAGGQITIDTTRIMGYGRSAAGAILAYAASNADLAALIWPAGTGPEVYPTNVFKGLILEQTQLFWPILVQDGSDTNPDVDFHAYMFPQDPAKTGNGNWDVPCDKFNETAAAFQGRFSPLSFMGSAGLLAQNRDMWIWFGAGAPDNAGAPWDTTHAVGVEWMAHSSWWRGALLSHAVAATGRKRGIATSSESLLAPYHQLIDHDALSDDFVARDAVDFARYFTAYYPGEPIEEQVLMSLIQSLYDISLASGYQTDLKLVQRGATVQASAVPAIAVDTSRVVYDDAKKFPYSYGSVTARIDCFLQEASDGAVRLSRMIADVRKALARRFYESAGGDKFGGLVHDLKILEAERLEAAAGQSSFISARITVRLEYRNLVTDPYSNA